MARMSSRRKYIIHVIVASNQYKGNLIYSSAKKYSLKRTGEESNKSIVLCIGPLRHVYIHKIHISSGPPHAKFQLMATIFTNNYASDG